MNRSWIWKTVALAVALGGSGCGSLGSLVKSKPEADAGRPALRLDRSSPYGQMAAESKPSAAGKPERGEAPVLSRETKLPEAEAAAITSNNAAAYKLRPGDSLVIAMRTPNQEQMESMVDEHGDIKLPYLGTVGAAGMTSSELENKIQQLYVDKKIYKFITVNVFVPLRGYFVRGEVRQPGRFQFISGVTLMSAIATAGGYTDFADRADVLIVRGDKRIQVNAKELERNPEKDIPLETGDTVIVNRSRL
jgi:protein involved in polysaccharide export with SLBB domain